MRSERQPRGRIRALATGTTVIPLIAILCGCTAPVSPAATRCSNLSTLKIDHVALVSVRTVSSGRYFMWKTALLGIPFLNVPASCRIKAVSTPTNDSTINIEIWIPLEHWNGRFQGLGNGGFAGSIDTLGLALALHKNYAVASTDTGHEGSDRDGSWALGHVEKLRDYGYRAIHETTVLAKTLIQAVNGRPPKYSYFVGGSNGGRAALMEAQRFPTDYDGVLAGCPALDPTDTLPVWARNQQAMLEVPGAYISPSKLAKIAAAVTRTCDAADGVRDGVLENPPACHFDPAILQCPGADADNCLNALQVQALRQIYSGPADPAGTTAPVWGFEPGGELGSTGWTDWLTGSKPQKSLQYEYVLEFYRYLIYDNPHWSLDQFEFARGREAAKRRLDVIMDATDTNLTAFKAHGGKLILFHGWNDPALPPGMTSDYYRRVRERMGSEQTDEFLRLYMVPGMNHCFGGPGPNSFGQFPPGGEADPRHNMSAALEHWVESGKPPAEIIAGKYANELKGLIAPESVRPLRTRPICAYPQVARWNGHGSTDIAENFTCVTQEP